MTVADSLRRIEFLIETQSKNIELLYAQIRCYQNQGKVLDDIAAELRKLEQQIAGGAQ